MFIVKVIGVYLFNVYNVVQRNKIIFCGLYYKHVTIVIYDRNDSVQYHKTTITIVIDRS